MVLLVGTIASGGILGAGAAAAVPVTAETAALAATGAIVGGGTGAVCTTAAATTAAAAAAAEAAAIATAAATTGAAVGVGSTAVAATGAAVGAGVVAGEAAAATALAGGLAAGAAEGAVASVAAASPSMVAALLPATPIGWFVLGAKKAQDKKKEQLITYDCWKPVLRDQTKCLSKGKTLNIILNDKRVNNYYFTKYNNLINWELIVTNIFNDKFKITPVIVNDTKYAHASIVE
jgi:hypothetical protein